MPVVGLFRTDAYALTFLDKSRGFWVFLGSDSVFDKAKNGDLGNPKKGSYESGISGFLGRRDLVESRVLTGFWETRSLKIVKRRF